MFILLPLGGNTIAVNKYIISYRIISYQYKMCSHYCHWVATQLQLTNISYHNVSYHINTKCVHVQEFVFNRTCIQCNSYNIWLYFHCFSLFVNKFCLTVTSDFEIYLRLLSNMLQHGVCHFQNANAK